MTLDEAEFNERLEGKNEGRNEGRSEGRSEERLETAENLYAMFVRDGMGEEEIVKRFETVWNLNRAEAEGLLLQVKEQPGA